MVEQLPLLSEPSETAAEDGDARTALTVHQQTPAQQPDSFEKMSREVWHVDGTAFKLDEPRLKAEGKIDYGKRLALTLVYAHEVEGKSACPRDTIVSAVEKPGVYDTNLRTFLRTFPGFDRDGDGENFRLNKQGRDDAKAALKRIFDESVAGPGWMPDGRGGKANEGDDKDAPAKTAAKGARGRKPSTKPKEWAQKWKSNYAAVDAHSLLNKRSNAEKGAFGLWAIHRVAGDSGKVVSALMVSKFLLEAFVFKIDPRNLRSALQSNACDGKVIKVAGGFQLQPPGSKWASDVFAGKAT